VRGRDSNAQLWSPQAGVPGGFAHRDHDRDHLLLVVLALDLAADQLADQLADRPALRVRQLDHPVVLGPGQAYRDPRGAAILGVTQRAHRPTMLLYPVARKATRREIRSNVLE